MFQHEAPPLSHVTKPTGYQKVSRGVVSAADIRVSLFNAPMMYWFVHGVLIRHTSGFDYQWAHQIKLADRPNQIVISKARNERLLDWGTDSYPPTVVNLITLL